MRPDDPPTTRTPDVLIKPGRTPIVVLGDDWGRHVSTLQHVFRRLIGRYPLVWVNSFGHRRPRLTPYDIKRAATKVAALMSNGRKKHVSSDALVPDQLVQPLALPWHDVTLVRSFNNWSLTRDIMRALQRAAPGERPLLISGTPAAFGLIGNFNELASIYFCIDDYGQIHGTDQDLLEPLEHQMLARVDALVATAASLTITRRPVSGNALHLPQGVNYEHFSGPMAMPAELAELPRPILGFAGGVGPAVDFTLILALAAAFPEASVVMVGPHQQDLSTSRWPSNVHFLGPRPYAELPAYVQAFDVGLVPYVHNDWTKAVDPLKLLEYLAAGIPVVTTGLPEAEKYSSVLTLADGPTAFVQAVRDALSANNHESRSARQRVAIGNRWEARAAELVRYAARIVEGRVTT